MRSYYNEIEPYVAQWLRNLIGAGEIAPGIVDERSIEDVTPGELLRYDRCHFFAGIGGWDYALRLAGWPANVPVWTGSCPCQPFSTAGKRGGGLDERHLWPAWYWLIRECKPAIIFGEQVASKDGLRWLDVVFADLEAAGYSCGAADLCAAGVGAPHIRQRLWFVAYAPGFRFKQRGEGEAVKVQGDGPEREREYKEEGYSGELPGGFEGLCPTCRAADGEVNSSNDDCQTSWSDLEWLPCRDGKARPTQPGLHPLAHGVSARVGRLRAYGNAIVPQVAAELIKASMEILFRPC